MTRLEPVRRLLRPLLGHLVATARRGGLLRERVAFIRRELSRSDERRIYTLRDSGLAISIRHGTPDVYGLDQAFLQPHFDPPEEVDKVLRTAPRPLRVVDLGANIGLFGVQLSGAFSDARIVAFEPDQANATVLRSVIESNRASHRWEVVEAAAATRDGLVRFQVGDFGVSRVVDDKASAPEVPAVDIFRYLKEVDLVKMDIEGAEWEILADDRLSDVAARVMNVEYHGHMCPYPDPAGSATQLLQRAGFRVKPGPLLGDREGILWAWKPQ